jgi:hypothetical protein
MRKLGLFTGLVSLLAGCPGPGPGDIPPPTVFPVSDGGFPVAESLFIDPRVDSDPVSLDVAPPPISGGTLRILSSGHVAIVADPDRDRILAVDLIAGAVLAEHRLPAHAEPTRVIEDADGRIHAVLRGTGEIYSFDPEQTTEGTRRAVCGMPRGLAFDARTDDLLVACRGGELVTLPAAGGAVTRTVVVDRDLRDVIISGDRTFVTRFRSAELIELDREGRDISRRVPITAVNPGGGMFDRETGAFIESSFEPAVAWRAVEIPGGGIAMVHQRASGSEVQPDPGGYGGGGSFCESSIVQSSVTIFREDGSVSNGPDLAAATLPVDIALSPSIGDQRLVTVVAAANESGNRAIHTYRLTSMESSFEAGGCIGDEIFMETQPANATSAAYASNGDLVVLSRDPAVLTVIRQDLATSSATIVRRIALGGEARFDTGHAVFHGNSGSFLACASCHPEGGDDARVWTFGRIGARRTPAMTGNLRGTEPFHWDGDMNDLSHLVHDVFTGRMAGPSLTPRQIDTLGNWLDDRPAPVPSAHATPDVIERGRALFNGEAQCASCHSGGLFTNSASFDVGTGGTFQVPSLVGVADRLPLMHSGCAVTLRDRFRPDCGGGEAHGRTAHLSESQLGELVAFLETL